MDEAAATHKDAQARRNGVLGASLNAPPGTASMPAVTAFLAALSLALLAASWSHARRRERQLTSRMSMLEERLREVSTRVEAAEADVAHAVTQVDITEVLLLEKGVADEEDLEAARRRFDSDPGVEGPEREQLH
jgi:hypothetical protein